MRRRLVDAIHQHVAHRLSLHSVQVMLQEFFGLRVLSSEVHQIKSLMAQYYQATYLGLLNKILPGNLLHIDETEMTLQTGKGYVWVFSNCTFRDFPRKPPLISSIA
jgi:hypothetical protein